MTPLCLALCSFPEALSVNPVEHFALGITGQLANVPLEEGHILKIICVMAIFHHQLQFGEFGM